MWQEQMQQDVQGKVLKQQWATLLAVCGDKHFAHCYLKDSNFPLTCANLPAAGLHHLDFHQKMCKCLIKFPLFTADLQKHTLNFQVIPKSVTSISWTPN